MWLSVLRKISLKRLSPKYSDSIFNIYRMLFFIKIITIKIISVVIKIIIIIAVGKMNT